MTIVLNIDILFKNESRILVCYAEYKVVASLYWYGGKEVDIKPSIGKGNFSEGRMIMLQFVIDHVFEISSLLIMLLTYIQDKKK